MKDKLNFKFMTSKPGKQTIPIPIFPNISRIKDNQTIKFGQLREYNMKNIYIFEKSWAKCGGETFPKPYSKKSKLSIFLDQ